MFPNIRLKKTEKHYVLMASDTAQAEEIKALQEANMKVILFVDTDCPSIPADLVLALQTKAKAGAITTYALQFEGTIASEIYAHAISIRKMEPRSFFYVLPCAGIGALRKETPEDMKNIFLCTGPQDAIDLFHTYKENRLPALLNYAIELLHGQSSRPVYIDRLTNYLEQTLYCRGLTESELPWLIRNLYRCGVIRLTGSVVTYIWNDTTLKPFVAQGVKPADIPTSTLLNKDGNIHNRPILHLKKISPAVAAPDAVQT